MSSSSLSSAVNSASPAPAASKGKGSRKNSLIISLKVRVDENGNKITASAPATATAPAPEPASTPNSGESAKSPESIPTQDVPAVVASPIVEVTSPTNSEGSKAATPVPKANGAVALTAARKRARAPGANSRMGPRAKKLKLDGTPMTNGPLPPSKLGPKGNQGAINAHLRALDRTGTQCKRWTRAEFKLKSFTGHEWSIKSYVTEKKPAPEQAPSDAASVISAASPDSAATPMEGVEQAHSPAVVPSAKLAPAQTADVSTLEKQESTNFQQTLVAPVV